MRAAIDHPEMFEIFLNREEACATSFCESVARGHSILTLRRLASTEEVAVLKAEAIAAAHERGLEHQGGTFSEAIAAAHERAGSGARRRMQMQSLGVPGQELCDALLLRALSLLEGQLVHDLFGDCIRRSPGTCVHNPQLVFSANEPAVNVYFRGGDFKAHEDNRALTVLMPLSTASVDFEGSGTAFWSARDAGPGGSTSDRALGAPTLVLRPPAGAALLWGGSVTHAGLPVRSGERCVFVASFSPKPCADETAQHGAIQLQSAIWKDFLAGPTTTGTASHRRMAQILGRR
jgi:hypothetical protein